MTAPFLAEAAAPPACMGRWTLFFGPNGETRTARMSRERRARAVCDACPVLGSCREYAIESGQEHGIWAGLTEEELAAERVRRARKDVAA